jgi:integrase
MGIRLELNEGIVRGLSTDSGRLEVEDKRTRHLFLRVTDKGHKSWSVLKRMDGELHRVTLGDWPTIKVERARKDALRALGEMASGRNPKTERKRKAVIELTVRQALDAYLAGRGTKLAERTVRTYEDDVTALMGTDMKTAVSDITRDVFKKRFDERSAASLSRANGGARVLRAVFNDLRRTYRDEKGVPLLPENPVAILSEKREWNKVEGRTDRIYASQIPAWWKAAAAERPDVASYFITLILTGQRRSEALAMRWDWLNLEEGILTIPAEFTKAKRQHELLLGTWLKTHLRARKEVCETRGTGPWVFPGHVTGARLVNPEKPRIRIAKRSGVAFTPHSLRRTFAGIASEQRVQPFVVRRLLNHSKGSITEAYAQIAPAELRAAMQAVEDAVLLAAGVKVVPPAAEPKRRTREAA